MLNILSLTVGLAAWAPGFAAVMTRRNRFLSFCSFAFCSGALVLQILEINRRVTASDWSGLLDTTPALTVVTSVLLAVTVLLNLLALHKGK